ncbi:MAG: (d)CMP kinase [Candidatus Kapabacteria bacterium]|jgi:cytidylate kinase|nr:(d)CMP kinase [Candidatus Kapabacteria bacterium]
MENIKIAVDGPAGSGKTTTAKIVAENLGYVYIDTGAMYRAVTLKAMRDAVKFDDASLAEMMQSTEIELRTSDRGQRTILNGEDVSEDIRLPEVTKNVSPVSAVGCVREKLVAMQRELGRAGAVVMDGRDIGTEVFPNAELKIFLVASVEARAERRTLELSRSGIEFSVEEIKKQITDRDHYDSTRKISPLRKASDAVEIDTSDMTIEEQAIIIIDAARKIIKA